ncbi:hypothetical protein GTR02_17480 [Kineococcus sp. R8]|nr:hypothetical protein [Kineococcus siccus]
MLDTLYGDELPVGDDPLLVALVDAIATDDAGGAGDGLVVQGDGLTREVLAELVEAAGPEFDTSTVPTTLLPADPSGPSGERAHD